MLCMVSGKDKGQTKSTRVLNFRRDTKRYFDKLPSFRPRSRSCHAPRSRDRSLRIIYATEQKGEVKKDTVKKVKTSGKLQTFESPLCCFLA